MLKPRRIVYDQLHTFANHSTARLRMGELGSFSCRKSDVGPEWTIVEAVAAMASAKRGGSCPRSRVPVTHGGGEVLGFRQFGGSVSVSQLCPCPAAKLQCGVGRTVSPNLPRFITRRSRRGSDCSLSLNHVKSTTWSNASAQYAVEMRSQACSCDHPPRALSEFGPRRSGQRPMQLGHFS